MLEIFDKVFGGNSANIDSLRESLEDNKQHVNDELAYYKSVAKDVLKVKKKVENASMAYSKRESAKNASKVDEPGFEKINSCNWKVKLYCCVY